MDNQVIVNWKKQKKNKTKQKKQKKSGTQVPCEVLEFVPWKNSSGTRVPWTWVLYMELEF